MKKLSFLLILISSLSLFAQRKDEDLLKMSNIKATQTLSMIDYFYVDSANLEKITNKGIVAMLKELDPHSVFIDKEEVAKMNEPLVGNFDGIGVSFQFMNDTIHVVEVISGGPSEKVGILAGDKIIKVDSLAATGDTIKNDWVFKHLRGKKGTKVEVSVIRGNNKKPIVFKITRDKIPLNSIDTWFMIDKEIGYIKLDRFAQQSNDELVNALNELKKEGMVDLILDLRSNGGGYLKTAFEICDQFLSGNKLIVYTQGLKSAREELKAEKRGIFETGRLVIMVDEFSASASEILSGAVQDWDRGVIVGRRTFGKGLVQRPFDLYDKSQIRLTTSRYYTPSGRCIQKPYEDGVEEYQQDYNKRLSHGELTNADSIHFADSLRYYTASNRVVYGGGGIIPDTFVPIDTTKATRFFINCTKKAVMMRFASAMFDKYASSLSRIDSFDGLERWMREVDLEGQFLSYAERVENLKPAAGEWAETKWYMMPQVKALVGRYSKLQDEAFYRFYLPIDNEFQTALTER